MAKKNSYKSLNLEDSKREIGNNLDATNKFNLDTLTDDIEYITSSTGQKKATVVASIESKMDAIIIVLKEIFEIDGDVYIATITEGHPMMGVKIEKDDTEVITPNRYINLAEIWIKKNKQLFIK